MTWHKIIARLTGLLARLSGRCRRHRARIACPATHQDELEMRAVVGMPAQHPESLTRELPADQEEYLADLAAGQWPDDEWTEIIIEIRRAEGQS
jgi:hypothetical protein